MRTFFQMATLLSHGFTIHCKGTEKLSKPFDKRQTTRERANEKMRAPETLRECNTLPRRANCRLQNAHSTWRVHEGHLLVKSTATAGRILVQKWVQTKVGESLLKSVEAQRGSEGWRTSRKLRSFLHLKWTTSSSALPDYS